jgi:MYXO-CTERM domain-containing protein
VTGTLVAPTITTQPASLTVTAGNNASFSVVAAGSAPLTYQWKFNGTSVGGGGTGSTYNLTGAQATDAGSYTVTITNTTGSVTSSAATLTVNAVPVTPPPSSGGGGGGGGAISPAFLALLALAGLARRRIRRT